MNDLNRRQLLLGVGLPLVFGAVQGIGAAQESRADERTQPDERSQAGETATIGLGFGTYGMKQLPVADALRHCAEIGYDGVELALLKGWPTDPEQLSIRDREAIRRQLNDRNLQVPSLLESLPCLRSPEDHRSNLERLRRAVELAHHLDPARPPLVQSIVGGKAAEWDRQKDRLAAELRDWAAIGEQANALICFKPHAAHVVDSPDRAWWLIQQIDSPNLKVVYDYSHFFLQGLSLEASLRTLLPIAPYVQVKDSRGTPSDHEYLLPGDGETDYVQLLDLLKQERYRGFVNVEVSSMIHRRPEYDPIATAKLCYRRLAPLFTRLGIRRPA